MKLCLHIIRKLYNVYLYISKGITREFPLGYILIVISIVLQTVREGLDEIAYSVRQLQKHDALSKARN